VCRGQLPVWQREWPGLRTPGARFITVSAEADVAAAQQFAGGLDFPTLVDTENRLAAVLGYRVIPNGYRFGPDGTLLDEVVADFDLRESSTVALVKGWLGRGATAAHAPVAAIQTSADRTALALFAEGESLLARGERERGLARWHKAYLTDPKSFVIRKQIWRVLYPDRFGDPIDTAWQRGQMARENALGFGAANPTLPLPD